MPIYAYVCECGAEKDEFNKVADRHTNAPECHGPMTLKLYPNLGYVQRDCHYECPVTRQIVTSNRQRKRIMDEHRLIDANDFPPEKAFEREEKKKARNEELAATLNHPLSDREMMKYAPPIPSV